jgi:ribosomal protein S8E
MSAAYYVLMARRDEETRGKRKYLGREPSQTTLEEEWDEAVRQLSEPILRSEILTARDYAITINTK